MKDYEEEQQTISKIPICRGSIAGPYIISVDPVIPFGFAQSPP
jgi:hypothetical protein